MIRFACPGCNATYSVDDSKGGKAGKCPKCQAQFVIPAADAAAFPPAPPVPPPPAPRLPPPPPAPAADAPVEIKPCPKCGARLSVAASDLGVDVECPYCQTVYTAKRAGAADPPAERPSRRRQEAPAPVSEGPARRSRRDDDEDDRPRRRRPAADLDDDDVDDRPRRRRDEDDDEDDRPRKKKKKRRGRSPAVDTVARLNYVLGALGLMCGFCIAGSGGLAGAAGGAAARQPGAAKGMPIDPAILGTLLIAVGVVQILFSILLIVAGIGVSKRQNWGRVMTLGTGGLGCVFGLLYLGSTVMNLIAVNIPGVIGALIGAGIWGGYGITALRTMLSHGDEFE